MGPLNGQKASNGELRVGPNRTRQINGLKPPSPQYNLKTCVLVLTFCTMALVIVFAHTALLPRHSSLSLQPSVTCVGRLRQPSLSVLGPSTQMLNTARSQHNIQRTDNFVNWNSRSKYQFSYYACHHGETVFSITEISF
jgi:hypothetical protein